MLLRAATMFSGIGAPEVARPDWDWRWCAEIEKFPAAVHALRHSQGGRGGNQAVPNLGDVSAPDFVERAKGEGAIDVLVFGSPCQSFSVAGKRLGLDDARGNLALVSLAVARQLRPRWLVFENVPGLLSSDAGRDFGIFLRVMEECGYLGAWRILDAQYAGVPQRRRRIFFVGYLGDWRPSAAVLFEPESLRGDSPPRREARKRIAPTISARTKGGGGLGSDFEIDGGLIADKWPADVAPTLNAHFGDKMGLEDQHALNGAGHFVMSAYRTSGNCGAWETGDRTDALNTATDPNQHVIAFQERGRPGGRRVETQEDQAYALTSPKGGGRRNEMNIAIGLQNALLGDHAGHTRGSGVLSRYAVRRLTPRECERLQGFPDDFTAIEWRGKPVDQCPDGPRYKALGNSMAVPVMAWILGRIETFEKEVGRQAAAA